MTELVSIIIAVKNGEKYIERCLNSLGDQNYSAIEIIVIDDGSNDSTPDILKRMKGIRIITTKGVGPSAARNLGIKEANGVFIAFTDADCLASPDWISELKKGFTAVSVVSVGGDQLSPMDESDFGLSVQTLFKKIGFIADYIKDDAQTSITPVKHNPTCNAMYRRQVLNDLGGFLEGLWPGEDIELDYRIAKSGGIILYNPGAIVYHYRADSYARFIRMMYMYGRAQGFLAGKYGFFRTIHFEPLFIMLLVILAAFMGFRLSLIAVLFTLAILAVKLRNFRVYLLFFLTLIYWNYGFFNELLFPKFEVCRHNDN